MAQRTKRRLKQRSRAHQKHVKSKQRVKRRTSRKVGYGARVRRKKAARK